MTTSGSQATKDDVQQCVFAFLRFCKAKRAGASITVAQDFIGERERQAGNRDEALRAPRIHEGKERERTAETARRS